MLGENHELEMISLFQHVGECEHICKPFFRFRISCSHVDSEVDGSRCMMFFARDKDKCGLTMWRQRCLPKLSLAYF